MTSVQRSWVAIILGAAGGLDLLVLNLLVAPAWIRESQASVPPTTSAVVRTQSAATPPAAITAPDSTARPAPPVPVPSARPQQAASDGPVVEEEPRFAVYSAELDPRTRGILQTAAERILASRQGSVLLRGHTDQRGDDKNNDQLSLQRASAAREFLISAGVPRSRIEVEAVGARQPLDPADTPEARARNRRVEILWRQ